MKDSLSEKLLQKEMTRKEFLKFAAASLVITFGFSNLIALIAHLKKTADTTKVAERQTDAHDGFGTRKFGT